MADLYCVIFGVLVGGTAGWLIGFVGQRPRR